MDMKDFKAYLRYYVNHPKEFKGEPPRASCGTIWVKGIQEGRCTTEDKDTSRVLAIVLSRIYTLRNQLIHGGATWNSSVKRDQIRDCSKILGRLVPIVIEIMLDNPQELWGQPCYPVISD